MADEEASASTKAALNFSHLTLPRQLGLLIGLAASVALGVGVVLWTIEPSYKPLVSKLSGSDTSEVIQLLEQSGMEYKLSKDSSTILVPAERIHETRIKLSAEGVPRGGAVGFEMFRDQSGFATSQFMENAKYIHALEAELARTVSNFKAIKAARVHLAIPKQTSFLRDKREPSASVFIDVYRGVDIKSSTIAAVVNLVASSIPDLNAARVTVVDKTGALLSEGGGNAPLAMADRFLDYRQQVESTYADRIQALLIPILGPGKVRAQVSAEIDFTSTEQTSERFNPEKSVVRSEQLFEESANNTQGRPASGVPGATSNKPPVNATSSIVSAKQSKEADADKTKPTDTRKQSTKNFELDKTISHTRNAPGQIKKLSVAVLVGYKSEGGRDTPLTELELKNIRSLVSNAIGLNPERGDKIDVINSNFAKPEPIEALPELPLWQQPWILDLVKKVAGGLFVLTLIFGLLRPMIKHLAKQEAATPELPNKQSMPAANQPVIPQTMEGSMKMVQGLARKDPQRVAQVVKTWVDA